MTEGLLLSLTSAAHLAAAVAASVHAIRIKREANSALLWLLVVWSFPLFGVLLYLTIGIDRLDLKTRRRLTVLNTLRDERLAREADSLPMEFWRAVRENGIARPESEWAQSLNRSLDPLLPDHPLLGGNRLDLLVCGDEAYGPMLEAIRAARYQINLQTFILANDRTGREFLDALAERARAGVQVRVLFDRFGSTPSVISGFFRRYRNVAPSFHMAGWTLANPLRRQVQINLRNHRKILVVDGSDAFTGGINIASINTTRPGRPAHRDFHFHLRGPSVQELQLSFVIDWHFITGEKIDRLLCRDCFPGVPHEGDARIRLIPGEPSMECDTLPDVFFALFVAARRQILLITPYFVPTPDLVRALRAAALRGVEVKLLMPRVNNHVYAGMAGRALYQTLLDAGVRIWEREPPFMHAKALLVDDEAALIGTANLDARSLRLNYETNLLVHDPAFLGVLKQAVLDEFAHGREIDPQAWRTRPSIQRFAENACALLAPVL